MNIERLDHLVLTVADIDHTCAFYTRVLGMEVVHFGEGRTALKFGQQKINLHPADQIPGLVADKPTPGSGDLCFITTVPLAEVMATSRGLRRAGRRRARTARWRYRHDPVGLYSRSRPEPDRDFELLSPNRQAAAVARGGRSSLWRHNYRFKCSIGLNKTLASGTSQAARIDFWC